MFLRVWMIGLLFLYLPTTMVAETKEARYRVSYGFLGEIGIAKAALVKDAKKYQITVVLEATGLAKVLSRGRKEKHISQGHLENGLMVSDSYSVIRRYGTKKIKKVYQTDHRKKEIVKTYTKTENGKIVSTEKKPLPYYAHNDLLTLYFNLASLISDKKRAKQYNFHAVGAERQNGDVTVVIPSADEREIYQRLLGDNAAWYATAIIHQKIFSSAEGELLLAIDAEGITQKAILKDVIFFGDITAVKQ